MGEEEAIGWFVERFMIIGLILFVAFLVALFAAPHKFRCPNCRKWFAERHAYADGTKECLVCHYKWHDPD